MRSVLLILLLLASAVPAQAADYAQAWARHLSVEGYQDIRLSRTWLGRVRIVAEKSDREREIVLNPRTGEVLRDLTRLLTGGTGLPSDVEDAAEVEEESGNSGSGSENSGSGSSNSGSGSGSSGSGSSGSGSSNSGSGSGNSGSGSGSSGSGSSNSGSGSGSSGSGSDD